MHKLFVIGMMLAGLGLGRMAVAEDPHPVDLGDVTGPGIALKMHDHAVAGAIKDFVIFGFVSEESGNAELTMRKDGQIIKTVFQKNADGRYGGVIRHTIEGKEAVTAIYLKKIDPAAKQIIFDINGAEVFATINAENYQNGHHINPTITAEMAGKPVSYKMQGEGCYAYLMFSFMMIAGAYYH